MNEEKVVDNPENTGEIQIVKPKKDTKFKKGQSGNPKGKPLGSLSLTAIIKKKLQTVYKIKNPKEKRQAIELLADRIIENGIVNGSERTQEKIWAYLDGQPRQTVDIGADKDSLEDLTKFFRALGSKKK